MPKATVEITLRYSADEVQRVEAQSTHALKDGTFLAWQITYAVGSDRVRGKGPRMGKAGWALTWTEFVLDYKDLPSRIKADLLSAEVAH